MRKNIIRGVFIILVVVLIIGSLPLTVNLYLHFFLKNPTDSNIQSSANTTIQIGYNILYLVIAIVVLLIAYYQLSKTREATTVQTLINLDSYLRSDDFLKKRKKLAEIIELNKSPENLKDVLRTLVQKRSLTKEEIESIACIKNNFESVIYQFELIGHFYKKHIFSIEDVYQLFSIEIQNYWILMSEMGYIEYLRENEGIDFYDKFENLFYDTLKQEIINSSSNLLVKYFSKFYYWSGFYKTFYQDEFYHLIKTKNKTSILIKSIRKRIPLFIAEEKSLID